MPALNKLYREYRDRAAFYVVYIQEAHPIDAWQVEDNVKDDVLVKTSAKTMKVTPGTITLKATTAFLKSKPKTPAPPPPKVVVEP